MAREILFKAKRSDNGEWVEGYLLFDKFDDQYRIIVDLRYSTGTHIDTMNAPRVQTDTICQYTGLTDKNGNKIWENDICDRKEKWPEIVKYHKGDFVLDYSYVFGKETGYNYCNLGFYVHERNCVEVIGNIFDNPELMEAGE